MDEVHILPIDDSWNHSMSDDCECCPTIEYEQETRLVIHNAFDCRELYEYSETYTN